LDDFGNTSALKIATAIRPEHISFMYISNNKLVNQYKMSLWIAYTVQPCLTQHTKRPGKCVGLYMVCSGLMAVAIFNALVFPKSSNQNTEYIG
jgi:hypothetical protein